MAKLTTVPGQRYAMAGQLKSIGTIKGEHGTGFEKENGLGEFECGNCSFFNNNSCNQPDMMRLSKQPRIPGTKLVYVQSEDCCEFVNRVGRKDEDEGE